MLNSETGPSSAALGPNFRESHTKLWGKDMGGDSGALYSKIYGQFIYTEDQK